MNIISSISPEQLIWCFQERFSKVSPPPVLSQVFEFLHAQMYNIISQMSVKMLPSSNDLNFIDQDGCLWRIALQVVVPHDVRIQQSLSMMQMRLLSFAEPDLNSYQRVNYLTVVCSLNIQYVSNSRIECFSLLERPASDVWKSYRFDNYRFFPYVVEERDRISSLPKVEKLRGLLAEYGALVRYSGLSNDYIVECDLCGETMHTQKAIDDFPVDEIRERCQLHVHRSEAYPLVLKNVKAIVLDSFELSQEEDEYENEKPSVDQHEYNPLYQYSGLSVQKGFFGDFTPRGTEKNNFSGIGLPYTSQGHVVGNPLSDGDISAASSHCCSVATNSATTSVASVLSPHPDNTNSNTSTPFWFPNGDSEVSVLGMGMEKSSDGSSSGGITGREETLQNSQFRTGDRFTIEGMSSMQPNSAGTPLSATMNNPVQFETGFGGDLSVAHIPSFGSAYVPEMNTAVSNKPNMYGVMGSSQHHMEYVPFQQNAYQLPLLSLHQQQVSNVSLHGDLAQLSEEDLDTYRESVREREREEATKIRETEERVALLSIEEEISKVTQSSRKYMRFVLLPAVKGGKIIDEQPNLHAGNPPKSSNLVESQGEEIQKPNAVLSSQTQSAKVTQHQETSGQAKNDTGADVTSSSGTGDKPPQDTTQNNNNNGNLADGGVFSKEDDSKSTELFYEEWKMFLPTLHAYHVYTELIGFCIRHAEVRQFIRSGSLLEAKLKAFELVEAMVRKPSQENSMDYFRSQLPFYDDSAQTIQKSLVMGGVSNLKDFPIFGRSPLTEAQLHPEIEFILQDILSSFEGAITCRIVDPYSLMFPKGRGRVANSSLSSSAAVSTSVSPSYNTPRSVSSIAGTFSNPGSARMGSLSNRSSGSVTGSIPSVASSLPGMSARSTTSSIEISDAMSSSAAPFVHHHHHHPYMSSQFFPFGQRHYGGPMNENKPTSVNGSAPVYHSNGEQECAEFYCTRCEKPIFRVMLSELVLIVSSHLSEILAKEVSGHMCFPGRFLVIDNAESNSSQNKGPCNSVTNGRIIDGSSVDSISGNTYGHPRTSIHEYSQKNRVPQPIVPTENISVDFYPDGHFESMILASWASMKPRYLIIINGFCGAWQFSVKEPKLQPGDQRIVLDLQSGSFVAHEFPKMIQRIELSSDPRRKKKRTG